MMSMALETTSSILLAAGSAGATAAVLLAIRARRWRRGAAGITAIWVSGVLLFWIGLDHSFPTDECLAAGCDPLSEASGPMLAFGFFILGPLGALLAILALVVRAVDGLQCGESVAAAMSRRSVADWDETGPGTSV
jgi:hypothetical protein